MVASFTDCLWGGAWMCSRTAARVPFPPCLCVYLVPRAHHMRLAVCFCKMTQLLHERDVLAQIEAAEALTNPSEDNVAALRSIMESTSMFHAVRAAAATALIKASGAVRAPPITLPQPSRPCIPVWHPPNPFPPNTSPPARVYVCMCVHVHVYVCIGGGGGRTQPA